MATTCLQWLFLATYPWYKQHVERGVTKAAFPHFTRWFDAMERRPAVRRNNAMAEEIFARMKKAAADKLAIDIYNTRDNAERLARASLQTTSHSTESRS